MVLTLTETALKYEGIVPYAYMYVWDVYPYGAIGFEPNSRTVWVIAYYIRPSACRWFDWKKCSLQGIQFLLLKNGFKDIVDFFVTDILLDEDTYMREITDEDVYNRYVIREGRAVIHFPDCHDIAYEINDKIVPHRIIERLEEAKEKVFGNSGGVLFEIEKGGWIKRVWDYDAFMKSKKKWGFSYGDLDLLRNVKKVNEMKKLAEENRIYTTLLYKNQHFGFIYPDWVLPDRRTVFLDKIFGQCFIFAPIVKTKLGALEDIQKVISLGDTVRVRFGPKHKFLSGKELVGVVVEISPNFIVDVDGMKLIVTNDDEIELLNKS